MSETEREPRTLGRLIAIGDIHGCSVALKTLLDAINPQADDTIVVLGDVIDRGPDSKGCVESLIDLAGRCHLILLRGNHEEMLFNALESRSELHGWLKFGGQQTLDSYAQGSGPEDIPSDHLRFLRSGRPYFETNQFIFVHASYNHDMSMPDQASDAILRWESVTPHRMRPHNSNKSVIAGHTPQRSGQPLDLGFMKVIDTDCSRGGWLSALEVRSGKLVQAKQTQETRCSSLK
ncbi:serine/threonine protein phosphatase 1 [Singulisphaera sp. GP187]|uniref:metallophosphoesterase family protein n=1 Tax=Singulisphaera sp. GP187 TaxID=1882752 RepID=UPI000928DB2E|nr:metallophosphoesterase family protein [Singulisphaera sp. GP187]SIN78064.1 serine/threonine protein phosphatase 1 [Singulisphaera sp. GP187]